MVQFVLSLLLLCLKALTWADASVSRIPYQCAEVTIPDDRGAYAELCFEGDILGPSPVIINEHTKYEGPSVVMYSVNSTELHIPVGVVSIEWDPPLVTAVAWEGDKTTDCSAAAEGEDCATCILCADGTVEADCTNLEQGRIVECGEVQVRDIGATPYPFFPFLAGKVTGSSTTLGVAGTSRAVASST